MLELIINNLKKLDLYPRCGVELEFFNDSEFIINDENGLKIEKERSKNQFEAIFEFSDDILGLVNSVNKFKKKMKILQF